MRHFFCLGPFSGLWFVGWLACVVLVGKSFTTLETMTHHGHVVFFAVEEEERNDEQGSIATEAEEFVEGYFCLRFSFRVGDGEARDVNQRSMGIWKRVDDLQGLGLQCWMIDC
jgi:hypothetical protein